MRNVAALAVFLTRLMMILGSGLVFWATLYITTRGTAATCSHVLFRSLICFYVASDRPVFELTKY